MREMRDERERERERELRDGRMRNDKGGECGSNSVLVSIPDECPWLQSLLPGNPCLASEVPRPQPCTDGSAKPADGLWLTAALQ